MAHSRTKFAILALLRIQPMSGYEMREFCRTRLKHFWNESFGQIYPTLGRLNEDQLIRTVEREGDSTRATYYEITKKGSLALGEWLRKPPTPRIIRDEFLLKLFCGKELPADVLEQHISTARQQALEQLDVLKLAGLELDTRAKGHPDSPYWRLVLRSGELALRARLEWCDEAQAVISKETKRDPKKKKKKKKKNKS